MVGCMLKQIITNILQSKRSRDVVWHSSAGLTATLHFQQNTKHLELEYQYSGD